MTRDEDLEATIVAKFVVMSPLLNERARRLWAAAESIAIGYGGDALVSSATGLARETIRNGRRQLADGAPPTERIRRPGAGRPNLEQAQPGLTAALERLVDPLTTERAVMDVIANRKPGLETNTMKVLVTGAGFIGGHVVARLLEMGHEVTVFDRYPRRTTEWDGGVKVFLGDIRDREAVMEAILHQDGVINLAGILGTMETVENPHPSIDTNIHGALNVFEGCRANAMNRNGVRGVQIAVGNHFMNNTYSITKTTAERFAFMFNREHKTRITVVRGLNAYGENQKHRPVRKITPNFIVRALRGEPIEIFGDGEQIMDMIYVKDLADILVRALTIDHRIWDRAFEAGTGRRTTVNQIAHLVNEIAGNKAGVKHLPMRAGEPERSVVLGDPSTLAPLGYSTDNLTPLEEGLERTVRWYRDRYDWKEALVPV